MPDGLGIITDKYGDINEGVFKQGKEGAIYRSIWNYNGLKQDIGFLNKDGGIYSVTLEYYPYIDESRYDFGQRF